MARLGREEFIIVQPDTDMKRAEQVAEGMRSLVDRAGMRNRAYGDSAASVALASRATGVRAQDSQASMIERADLAMYRAKHRGRNQVAALA